MGEGALLPGVLQLRVQGWHVRAPRYGRSRKPVPSPSFPTRLRTRADQRRPQQAPDFRRHADLAGRHQTARDLARRQAALACNRPRPPGRCGTRTARARTARATRAMRWCSRRCRDPAARWNPGNRRSRGAADALEEQPGSFAPNRPDRQRAPTASGRRGFRLEANTKDPPCTKNSHPASRPAKPVPSSATTAPAPACRRTT